MLLFDTFIFACYFVSAKNQMQTYPFYFGAFAFLVPVGSKEKGMAEQVLMYDSSKVCEPRESSCF